VLLRPSPSAYGAAMDEETYYAGPYSWARQFNHGLCVGVVRGASVDAVAAAVARDGQEFPTAEAADDWVWDTSDYNRHWTAVGAVEDAVFTWEDNGWNASDPQIAAPLSAAGSVTSVFWNVNAHDMFLHAVDGSVVRSFEPLFRGRPDQQAGALPEEAGLVWWAEDQPRFPGTPALELLKRLTGLSPHPGWLDLPGVRFFGTTF